MTATYTWYSLFGLLVAASGGSPRQAARPAHAPPYRIAAIHAKLFYDHSGTFSEDILSRPKFALWNTIIGEGGAREPSHATLVIVEVRGQAGAYEPSRKVEVTASIAAGGKGWPARKVRRVVDTGVLSGMGVLMVPLWLDDTGCERIALDARLVGQSTPSRVRKTIEFRCGE